MWEEAVTISVEEKCATTGGAAHKTLLTLIILTTLGYCGFSHSEQELFVL